MRLCRHSVPRRRQLKWLIRKRYSESIYASRLKYLSFKRINLCLAKNEAAHDFINGVDISELLNDVFKGPVVLLI